MAITNHERIGKALGYLQDGLAPFVERELKEQFKARWFEEFKSCLTSQQTGHAGTEQKPNWEVANILKVMSDQWHLVFKKTLGNAERSLVSELREVRNQWAHQNPFSGDDAYRALDSATRLLTAVSAPQAEEVEKMRMELLRVRFDEQVRTEKRRSGATAVESTVTGNLKPWREVASPHKDVATGRYQQAEFAADLWQVHIGEGSEEYKNPVDFYRRTYLTEGLKQLVTGAIRRIAGSDGDPVVQLQTNFGGGKTHSMLALYHLFSGTPPGGLLGIDAAMQEAGVTKLPKSVRRVVLVGNRISPGNPSTKSDGTVIRTLWGELAWQLGGKKAFSRVKEDDERATSPGDVLRELLNEYSPCLILIDEWVAYARQLHDGADLPGGSFETHFTFAQALTESAKLAKQCLLVVSLPASDTSGSPHTRADDVEVGGERGRAALDRLRNAIGRVEASWRPASAEEGFEIVRRRLFEPLVEKEQFVARDTVAQAFHNLYQTQRQEFPPECHNADYETRIKAAYPIHPEVFDRLYTDWSTLVKFQRTRGVLRLMAAVIHSLWEKEDRNPLILPGNIPIDDPRVQAEMTRYLSDNWVPVIEKDVDGPNALPLRLDGDFSNLGKFAACRRVARTVYLGSAPTATAANRGIEDRRVRLGCVMPGESPAIFGDALKRLCSSATYLYQDGTRYWYSTQPTVMKLAEDRAEQLKRNPDAVAQEVDRRLRANLNSKGDFCRVHALPQSGQDVPDDLDARLVVLGIDHPYSKVAGNQAEVAAKAILESRGNAPRLFRNSLVFLAIDQTRLQDLDEATRRYLAWKSIFDETETLNLDPHQEKQAESQKVAADGTVTSRLPEAYQWLIVPTQSTPQSPIEWQVLRLSGQEALAERASKKLRGIDGLYVAWSGTSLKLELDRIPLWQRVADRESDHVQIQKLAEDFAKYLYLPRLKNTDVLYQAIRNGLGLLTWEQDSFAYADSYDEDANRYRGLQFGQNVMIADGDSGLLVRSVVARKQFETEKAKTEPGPDGPSGGSGGHPGSDGGMTLDKPGGGKPKEEPKPKRFHGTVILDTTRVGRDAGRIADEVIAHLSGLVGSRVTITLEIEAEIPSGAPDNVVRTVTENSRTLKFRQHGFEKE